MKGKYVLSYMLSLLNRIIVKKRMVSFASFPDYSDNAKVIYEYMVSKCGSNEYEYIWHVNDTSKVKSIFGSKVLKKGTVGSILYYMKSKYVFSTHGIYDSIKTTKNQTRVLLWHGMPLKKIGYLNKEDVEKGVQIADYYCVTSQIFKDVFVKAFRADEEKIIITGQPRNDELFAKDNEKRREFEKSIGSKYIIYLPTYRKSEYRKEVDGNLFDSEQLLYGGTSEDWIELDGLLEMNSTKMVIKPHPMEAKQMNAFKDLKNIVLISDEMISNYGISLNQIMAGSTSLVTDYSSAYIDYLLLNRPICFFVPDMDDYKKTRGFVFEQIEKYFPGPIARSFSDLKHYLFEKDEYEAKRERINNLFNDIKTPTACKNVLKVVLKSEHSCNL